MTPFRVSKPKALLVLTAAVALALTGCGDQSLVKVTGQVVENGTACALADGEAIQIDFLTADDAYPPLALGTFVKKNGSFAVDMNDGTGRGLPPGKYKVRFNREGTTLNKAPNPKLFKEAHALDVGTATPSHLTVDLATGTIAP